MSRVLVKPAGEGAAFSAAPLVPPRPTLRSLRRAAAGCRACDLWRKGKQTVFGEGPADAYLVLVGEQPGDREDVAGKPFVGPAGRVLDRALEDAGIDRGRVYITNAVKHFNWEPRGGRRIHKKPNAGELGACRPWLDAELDLLDPLAVVALGATAAKSFFGREFKVSERRGEIIPKDERSYMATVHPSSILRQPDEESRRVAYKSLVADLKRLEPVLNRPPA